MTLETPYCHLEFVNTIMNELKLYYLKRIKGKINASRNSMGKIKLFFEIK